MPIKTKITFNETFEDLYNFYFTDYIKVLFFPQTGSSLEKGDIYEGCTYIFMKDDEGHYGKLCKLHENLEGFLHFCCELNVDTDTFINKEKNFKLLNILYKIKTYEENL